MGCSVIEIHHLPDDESATKQAVTHALDGRCDLVVTVGGISAGKRDYFPTAFEHANVKLAVKGANIQPGKPIIIGSHTNGIVLGLPGNPVSALACCCIFGWPIVLGLLGCSTALPWQTYPLAGPVKPNSKRTAFRPSQIVDGNIVIPSWQGSGDLTHTSKTTGLAQLPSAENKIEADSPISYLAYPWS
jgi:molybdopterin molybdotransferase